MHSVDGRGATESLIGRRRDRNAYIDGNIKSWTKRYKRTDVGARSEAHGSYASAVSASSSSRLPMVPSSATRRRNCSYQASVTVPCTRSSPPRDVGLTVARCEQRSSDEVMAVSANGMRSYSSAPRTAEASARCETGWASESASQYTVRKEHTSAAAHSVPHRRLFAGGVLGDFGVTV